MNGQQDSRCSSEYACSERYLRRFTLAGLSVCFRADIGLYSFRTRCSSDLPGIVGSNTGACIVVNAPGAYVVVATSAISGCTSSMPIAVTQNVTPLRLSLTNAPLLNCLTTTAQIFATSDSGATFSWPGPGIIGVTNGNSITLNASGTYAVVVTGVNGCTATQSITVNQDITPPSL